MDLPHSNPFATRYTAPGLLPWIADANTELEDLARRFFAANLRGAIVGPHGSGKSTMLEHLVPRLGIICVRRNADSSPAFLSRRDPQSDPLHDRASEPAKVDGRKIIWLQLRRSEPNSLILPLAELSSGDLLVLDGYEQLTMIRRAIVLVQTRIRRAGLLVTSHGRTILPTLCELHATPEVAARILSELVPPHECSRLGDLICSTKLEPMLKSKQGNMRELLMDLYDRFEELRDTSWKTK